MKIDSPAKQLFFTTVRLDTVFEGMEEPYGNGTGFFYNIPGINVGEAIPFVVTNRHVIEDIETKRIASQVSLTMIPKRTDGEPDLGKSVGFEIDNVSDAFTFHPDPTVDIAVLLLMPLISEYVQTVRPLFYRALSIEIAPNESIMRDLDAIEDVAFVGYPDGRFDTYNKTPIVRHGATATPIHWPWMGAKKFLIDASVFPGSSGSPVFVVHRRGYKQGEQFLLDQGRVLFVGILSEVYRHGADVEYAVSNHPISGVREVLDLGVVYRWELVEEAIDEACKRFGVRRPPAAA